MIYLFKNLLQQNTQEHFSAIIYIYLYFFMISNTHLQATPEKHSILIYIDLFFLYLLFRIYVLSHECRF